MRHCNIALACVVQAYANGRDDPPITDGALAQILRSPRITRRSWITFSNQRGEV